MVYYLWYIDPVRPGPIFCLLLGVSSDYAQPITGQVTEVTCPVIGRAQPELTPSKRQKTDPGDTATSEQNKTKPCAYSMGFYVMVLYTGAD